MMHELELVALFIDVDNLLISAQEAGLPCRLKLVVDRVRQEGTLMSARAYGDWSSPHLFPLHADFRQNAIEQVQLYTSNQRAEGSRKNAADIQLAVDALEMVLSPAKPSKVVIVGGDSDFVPLVLKLKRFGVNVVGIGVQDSTSNRLAQTCNAFIYYDDLVPPSPGEQEAAPVDLKPFFALLRSAVLACIRDGRSPVGAAMLPLMRQMDATFDLARLKMSMKGLAIKAQEGGYVEVIEQPGSDFALAATGDAPDLEVAPVPRREYDTSTPAAALASYRTIMQEQRIPLLPWYQRLDFVRFLWDEGQASMDAMRESLLEYAERQGLRVVPNAILKLLYSLNFARCFSMDGRTAAFIRVPLEVSLPIHPLGTPDEALRLLHRNWVYLLVRAEASLLPQAVAELLFDDATVREQHLAEVEQICDELQPPTAMARALRAIAQDSGGG